MAASNPALKNGGQLSSDDSPKNGGYLSIASRAQNGGYSSSDDSIEIGDHSSSKPLALFERRRVKLGISIAALCAAAGVHPNTYDNARFARSEARPSTMTRLNKALNALAAGEAVDEQRTLCQAMIRLLIVQVCRATGVPPDIVLAQHFNEEQPSNADWVLASRMRRVAIYLMVEGLGLGKAVIGRAIGCSRQAVHISVAAIEAERARSDDFDALVQSLMDEVKA